MEDIEDPHVQKEHTVAAINILVKRQGHPDLSDVQINMVHAMVLKQNSLNQLATGNIFLATHYS